MWLGVPFAKGRKRRRNASFCLPNNDADPAAGPAQHRAQRQKQNLVERENLDRLARIAKRPKMRQKIELPTHTLGRIFNHLVSHAVQPITGDPKTHSIALDCY